MKDGNKRTLLKFYANQKPGNNKLNFSYLLPKYSLNKQSLIKVCSLMIEYCLFIDDGGSLKLDSDIYKTHCTKLLQENEIEFMNQNPQRVGQMPSLRSQIQAVTYAQKMIRGFLARKNKPKNKISKSIVYQSCVRISGSLFLVKLMEMKVKESQKHYFLYVQSKGAHRSADEHKQFEFEAGNMKDYELSKDNLDILFKQFTKIDLLDDDDLEIDWDGFISRMQQREEFEQEFKFVEMDSC